MNGLLNAQVPDDKEIAGKIEHLCDFIYWTPGNQMNDTIKPFTIHVIGDQNVYENFKSYFNQKRINKKQVLIKHSNDIEEITDCQILFIGKSLKQKLPDILTQINNKPILTISDSNGFAEMGVLINFYETNSKTPFEINESAVKKTGLGINHLLLKVVKIVQP
jgi:hypothetical protein